VTLNYCALYKHSYLLTYNDAGKMSIKHGHGKDFLTDRAIWQTMRS